MKQTLQRKGHIAHSPHNHVGTSKVKKGIKRQKGPARKASEVLNRQLSISEPSSETRKEATRLELKSEEAVDPSTKIKLQLFPVDEATRIGLEKDGLNPYLELTLRGRKKISSVINHIQTKWGGSSIAIGEPMLLPFESHLRKSSMSSRWTSKDTAITAGHVYTAIDTPPVFRLSYGWFSDHDPPRVSSPTSPHNCSTSESIQTQIQTTQEKKLLDATTQVDNTEPLETKVKIGQTHEQPVPVSDSVSPWHDDMTNLSIGGLLSEASLQGKLHNNNYQQTITPIKWEDEITNLSIGGLLSEASMHAKINKIDPKSFNSDSFDAILSSQIKNDPQVSILDAEETCHAFSFRKFSASSKNVRVSARASQDLSSSSFKFPNLLEADKQTVHAEDAAACSEPKPELFPRPQQQFNEDSRSLGLRGLSWNESLGPFDLGNSLPWKV